MPRGQPCIGKKPVNPYIHRHVLPGLLSVSTLDHFTVWLLALLPYPQSPQQ